jgi:hypothetical protein
MYENALEEVVGYADGRLHSDFVEAARKELTKLRTKASQATGPGEIQQIVEHLKRLSLPSSCVMIFPSGQCAIHTPAERGPAASIGNCLYSPGDVLPALASLRTKERTADVRTEIVKWAGSVTPVGLRKLADRLEKAAED